MKYIALIILLGSLAACKKTPVVDVYNEVTSYTESGSTVTTGVKFILLKDADAYSAIKVLSVQEGVSSVLATYNLEPVEHYDHGISIRFYPYRGGVNQWSMSYRLPGTLATIYSEDVEEGWRVYHAEASRHGRMDDATEVLNSFVLIQDGKYFDRMTDDKYSMCDSVDDYLDFSTTKPDVRFVLLILEK